MATFNQQHQRVEHQFNGEVVNVNAIDHRLIAKIDELIVQTGQARDGGELAPVVHCLEAARTATAAGDRGRAVTLLRRAAELAAPVAALVTSISAVVQGFQ